MKKISLIDCCGYILLKGLGPLVRLLPVHLGLFLGRRLGDLFYTFDARHRRRAYANIKTALGDRLSPAALRRVTINFYRAYGQNIIDIFLLPRFTAGYMKKYVTVEGKEHIVDGLKKGKGVILLAVHEGSWELTNLVCVYSGLPFVFFSSNQAYPRMEGMLNSWRRRHGCRIIERESGARALVEALKTNQVIGMTADQGGKDGTLVKFFGKEASMSSGAIRMALKYGTSIIPAYYVRLKGPYVKVTFEPALSIRKSADAQADLSANLQEATHIFERYIRLYPAEYLWTYKIWKYGRERKILILSDAKAGHLRQSETLAALAADYFRERGIKAGVDTVEVEFKNNFSKRAVVFSSCLSAKRHCQGCLWCLKAFLKEPFYAALIRKKFDLIISCGSALAAVNYALSRENCAKSVVIMRPSILSMRRFSLVIMPRHDNPPRKNNLLVIDGALNLINKNYLEEKTKQLTAGAGAGLSIGPLYIGLLIGGDAGNFKLDNILLAQVVSQVKGASQSSGAGILVTTSRRTAKEAEELLINELRNVPASKLLIIANQKNNPAAIGGILGLSQVVVVSPESISMISEAAVSGAYVVVFDAAGLGRRHRRFLEQMHKNGFIYLSSPDEVGALIIRLLKEKPKVNRLDNSLAVKEALAGMGL